MNLHIDTIRAVPASTIIPSEWKGWIWGSLSEDAPFSWGDNNHTLVDPFDFGDHLQRVLDIEGDEFANSEEAKYVHQILKYMEENNLYVDLEG